MTPDRRTLLALFSLAFGLRILYAALFGSSPDIVHETYDYRIASGIAGSLDWVMIPSAPTAPGYRTLLWAAFTLMGTSWWIAVLVNSVLGAITTLFLYRIGEKRLGRRVGVIAALWLGLLFSQIHFASIVERDVLATFLFVWFVYSIVKPFHRMRGAVASALLYVALTYIEPLYLVLLPLVLVYLAMWSTHHRALSVQYVFLFFTTLVLLNVPWTVRNMVVRRDVVINSLEAQRYTQPLARLLRDTPPEPPPSPEATTIHRPGFLYNTVEFWRVARFRDFPGDPARGLPPEPAWSLRHNLTQLISMGVLLPFFLVGAVAAYARRHRAALILTGSVLAYALLRGIYGADERSRLQAEPLIALVALYGVFVLLEKRRAAGA